MDQPTLSQAFAQALEHHRSGRLSEAETLYRQIIDTAPNHADAWHYLGVIAHQRGNNDLAVQCMQRAVQLEPNDSSAHSNLGEAYRALGRSDDAMASYHRALDLQPDNAEAHFNLGNLQKGLGHYENAIAAFQRAIELKADYPQAQINLGSTLWILGRKKAAEVAYERSVALRPTWAPCHFNLGIAQQGLGKFDAAIASYRKVLELDPSSAQAYYNLGYVLEDGGRADESIAAYREALRLKPDFWEAALNLGHVFCRSGQPNEAVPLLRRALELNPSAAGAHSQLGLALRNLGQPEAALSALRRALQLDPLNPAAHNNLGNLYRDGARIDEAIAAFRQAIALNPSLADIRGNLAGALKDSGHLDEAIAEYRHALEIAPNNPAIHSSLIYTLHFHPGISNENIREEQKSWERKFGDPLKVTIQSHRNSREPDRRLRIGYVSPDFRGHVIGRNLLPLFRQHDHQNFEIFCYSTAANPDGRTQEFYQLADHWRTVTGIADEPFAETIRRDGIDVLIDLSQHLAHNRLPVFARRPAPVPVSFAGYPASTGLAAIPNRISDRWLEADTSTEQVHLLDCFWCYDPCGVELPINSLPARERGQITFGSLTNFCKINAPVLKLWARLLQQVDRSRLLLLSGLGAHRQKTLDFLQSAGVEPSRVEFVIPRPRLAYLRTYHEIDIALDPFPYGGHNTTLDALWMGVPVVSLAGQTSISRAGLSILHNLGAPELVAQTPDDYLRIASDLATNLGRLNDWRTGLRSRMESSVLMDRVRFSRQIEAIYRDMWLRWCGQS